MTLASWFGAGGHSGPLELLREDSEFALFRTWNDSAAGQRQSILTLIPVREQPTAAVLNRLTREYELKDRLDPSWAVRPLELVRERGRTLLRLSGPEGLPLDNLIGAPTAVTPFLRIAVAVAQAVVQLHARGLVHKDIKPANILIDAIGSHAWLTGFGIASDLPRERQSPDPPEFIAGTLAYMAPEQTGRMNRSIDSRSDLYSLGITLYQLLTGRLPFSASDAMEWVHSHIARNPAPPGELLADLPVPLSAIVMKLLAKTAEERYQTAEGLENDLRRCLAEWERGGHIDAFALGERDTPGRLVIPEKLYGRGREIQTLLASFDRVVTDGTPELVLVSGYAGIGKSSVVNELHKVLVPPRGLYASGKFDQYKRDIPYATLAQAFQYLVRPLLSKPESELRPWRDSLREALGPNGLLMLDLVPELKHIIGEQPPVPSLAPLDAQRRFQLVFRRFIGVFARPEHPLAVFLDDLQWLDAATLDLLEDLLSQTDVRYLMLVGAYRDNEVDQAHPLRAKLETIRAAGAAVREVVLAPLAREDLEQLIGDCLRCASHEAAPLAALVGKKTAGNPFFVVQFLTSLAEEGLLVFEHRQASWSWDLERILAKGYTDNVVDLMVAKMSGLPERTRIALQKLACLGNTAGCALLAAIDAQSQADIHRELGEAIQAGMVLCSEGSYKFLHDRVQEAAYSLIKPHLRAAMHLEIGRLLVTRLPEEQRPEAIFEIVNQLNRGAHLITSRVECTRVAELNLLAGRRAKNSTAYVSALKYLAAGRALLGDESWDDQYSLVCTLEMNMAECELLSSDKAAAGKRLLTLARRARTIHDIATVTRLRLTLHTTLDRSDLGVQVCLEYLQRVGIHWSPHPNREEVTREYQRIWEQLGGRQIEDLIDLPTMTGPEALDTLEVLTEVITPALFSDEHLCSLVICHAVNLSLEHGNSDGSCFAYVWLAIIAGPRFGNYEAGARFGRLGYDLVEKRGLKRFQARTYMSYGDIVLPWTTPVRTGRDLVRRALRAADENGDLTFAAYSRNHLITNLLSAGEPLQEIQREAESGLAFARKIRFGLVVGQISAQLGLIRTLRGMTPQFGSFDHDGFDERNFERRLTNNPPLAEVGCWYSVRKLQARFLAGDHAAAIVAARTAQQLLWTSPSQFETAEFHFYAALAHAVSYDDADSQHRQEHLQALLGHHDQLQLWAGHCPENFSNRAALTAAEIARIEHRDLDAQRLYEQAIHSAHTHGFIHNEAIAYETAARFYTDRGFDRFGQSYLREARDCYLRWGAEGKVRQLEQLYPQLTDEIQAVTPTSTIGARVEYLDLGTVIKLSEAVSGETVLEKLIDTLMRTAIQHAGAERGLLILAHGDQHRIMAEATTHADTVAVGARQSNVTAADLPESVLHYVVRTRESLLLHDASSERSFSSDGYIRSHRSRSILCLPLLKESRLVGILYLENNLAPHAFTTSRMPVLKLLASQAAISLENTRLYGELQERELRYREASEELARANRIATLGQMSASIAHEINQPIAATVTNAQAALRFLDAQQPNLPEVRQALQRITRLGHRVADVVGRVRALVQKGAPRMDRFDVNEAIDEVVSLSNGEIVKHDVIVHTRFSRTLPSARADRVQLQQVVLNLLMNSVEALGAVPARPRELRLSTGRNEAGEILVKVEDSGPGLDPVNRTRIFDPFYTTKREGLGIGLSICRSIIEVHGGRLWTEPSELGGAAFAFTLPADPGPAR
jgi:predicted ATPase/signal transduction histidine kinase